MTPADEEFLTRVHQNLDKQAIPPTSEFYVPLEEQPGNVLGVDPVPMLARQIRRSSPGSLFFLTGLRGSGKSSQLMRLRLDLQRDGFAVLMLDADEYLNLRRPVEITDMLLFLVGAISDQAVTYDLIDAGDGAEPGVWSRLKEWLVSLDPQSVELTAKIPQFLDAKLSLRDGLRDNPSFVLQLREFLNRRLDKLVGEAHRIVEGLVEAIRARWTAATGVGSW